MSTEVLDNGVFAQAQQRLHNPWNIPKRRFGQKYPIGDMEREGGLPYPSLLILEREHARRFHVINGDPQAPYTRLTTSQHQ